MNRFVIVGNGVAGVEAAKTIRENDSEADITIVSKESECFYYRTRLIEYLAGKVDFAGIIACPEKWYIDRKVKCYFGSEIETMNEDDKTIVLDTGETLEYTKLLLANGSNPFFLPVGGNDKAGVFTIKNKSDIDEIKEYCKGKHKIVVAGGGLLGLETANGLKELGLDVTVVEFANRLLPRQLDAEGSQMLEEILEEKGLNFLLNESISKIVGEDKVEKIELNSEKTIDADAVIFSIGVRPRRDLADKLGVQFNRGTVVNDYMQTSKQDIYAAGDVAEHNGTCYGLWIPAKEQGAVAGYNMVFGNKKTYFGSKIEARLKVAGISLFSAGIIQGEWLVEKVTKPENTYVKTFEENGVIVGAIVIGDVKEANRLSKIIG